MHGTLTPGTSVMLLNYNVPATIQDMLGAGGQGEVYRVAVSGAGTSQEMALKWYHPGWATPEQWNALATIVSLRPPNHRFLWPLDLAGSRDARFGYLMPLRPGGYRPLADVMGDRVRLTFPQVLTAGLHLSDAFLALHSMGLCYRDISFGNVFVEPRRGDVLIVDNDNVAVEGEAPAGIRGTGLFMAPEILRGEALPSIATDLYSLSVLLFHLLLVHHPLDGARVYEVRLLDPGAATHLYGTDPLFIFDPDDSRNRPHPEQGNAMAYWSLYPKLIRDLFVRAFTEGLRDPSHGRVKDSEWRNAMAQLLDLLVPCNCGAGVFLEPDAVKPVRCWSENCGRLIPTPPVLMLDPLVARHPVMLYEGKTLHPHHLRRRSDHNFGRVEGVVVQHPTNPELVGLRNVGHAPWGARAGESWGVVAPGRSVTLDPGTEIDFGSVWGRIHMVAPQS